MSTVHPLYYKILEDLINQDDRDFLPDRAKRLQIGHRYLEEETEELTETQTQKTIPPG